MIYSQPDGRGHFKEFGGKYVPETLIPAINELEDLYLEVRDDIVFQGELSSLLKHYSGRPTPLYYASRISEEMGFPNELFVINNPCSLLGDLNFDEELNVLDILLLVDILLYGGFESYDECGDINSDGNLDVMDVVNLVGLILDYN